MAHPNIKAILAAYGIKIDGHEFFPGDFIDEYVLNLAAGTRFSKIEALAPDIARELKSQEIIAINDIENGVVRLQLNKENPIVYLADCIADVGEWGDYRVPIILGRDTTGAVMIYDLVEMIHTLICGATKSGKSVMLRSIISLLLTQDNVRLVLIDPKLVEFKHFENSNKLATNVITNPADAVKVLNSLVEVMESRYKILSQVKAVNIERYHDMGHENEMPYIVVICDELADLMISSGKAVEEATTRLAAKARAVGIYLIFSTQRASTDVVTGNIKVNFSTRICFRVPTSTDSRVVLDQVGGNKLKGYGDGLLATHLESRLIRFQGAFISEETLTINDGARDFNIFNTKLPVINALTNKIKLLLKNAGDDGATVEQISIALDMKSGVGVNNIIEALETNDCFVKIRRMNPLLKSNIMVPYTDTNKYKLK